MKVPILLLISLSVSACHYAPQRKDDHSYYNHSTYTDNRSWNDNRSTYNSSVTHYHKSSESFKRSIVKEDEDFLQFKQDDKEDGLTLLGEPSLKGIKLPAPPPFPE